MVQLAKLDKEVGTHQITIQSEISTRQIKISLDEIQPTDFFI